MLIRKILIIATLFSIISCSEREIFDDINEPPITGLFKEISGNISGDLLLKESPYKVTSDLIIPPNQKLNIESGVEVYFTHNTRLIVNGELVAIGSYYRSILFAAYDKALPWRGIKIFNASARSRFDYVFIKDIREPGDQIYNSSGISIVNSQAEFLHAFIYENSAQYGGGIGAYDNSNVIIKNSIFRDNSADIAGGAIVSENSTLKIINNHFYQNHSHNSCGGVFVVTPVSTELQNNIFYKNTSQLNNPHFEFTSTDSSGLIEQYNFFAFGNMDPQFYTPFDLRLFYLSPCKNAGNPEEEFNDYDGSRNDQGAYGGPLGYW